MSDRFEPAGESDLEAIRPLLSEWPHKPWAGCGRWSEEHLIALLGDRVARVLHSPYSSAWISRCEERVTGFVCSSALPWDTEQLGLDAARIDYCLAWGDYDEQVRIKAGLLAHALGSIRGRRIQHWSARLDASDLSGIHALEQAGFVVVDGLLTLARETNAAQPSGAPAALGFDIRVANEDDADAASALARCAYRHDRFHADPAISAERADALHAAWLRNSCMGQAADVVLVAADREGLLGYVTCKLQPDTRTYLGELVGSIVLVATAARARRRGVGRAMTLAAVDWFREQGASLVEVGTQWSNIPASRLYESCGFRLAGSSISLRRLGRSDVSGSGF